VKYFNPENEMGNLILAGPYKDRLASWARGLEGIVSATVIADKLDAIKDNVIKNKPHALLLDFELIGLNGANGAASLRSLCAESRIIIMGNDLSEDLEWELLKAGVRGCCQNDIKPEFLKQVIVAVQNGELWIRRSLTSRLVDEFSKSTPKNKAYQSTLSLLNKLTRREYDIAVRVGKGENNKQIAKACAITERTVKAHLTEIYLKLGVTDRLNLALVISADNRSDMSGMDEPSNRRLGGSRIEDNNL
jgi:DNA-binding NarL/FixJ family response regulator